MTKTTAGMSFSAPPTVEIGQLFADTKAMHAVLAATQLTVDEHKEKDESPCSYTNLNGRKKLSSNEMKITEEQ